MSQCKYCGESGKHYCKYMGRIIAPEMDASSFLISAAIGAATGSTILGGLVGGSFLGGLLGDSLNGDIFGD